MKTAMQELFSQLEIEHPNLFNTNTLEGRKFINDYYKFFEMEKEQIIDAYQQGFNNAYFSNPLSKEQYYNETFKLT
jgi:hypothetical protein